MIARPWLHMYCLVSCLESYPWSCLPEILAISWYVHKWLDECLNKYPSPEFLETISKTSATAHTQLQRTAEDKSLVPNTDKQGGRRTCKARPMDTDHLEISL